MKIGFFTALSLILITLKLTGLIAWSWFWVLFAIAIPACLALIFVIAIIFIALLDRPIFYKK
jgi:hypothetical protein